MKPLGNKVYIELEPAKKQTDSGIYLQENWKTLPPMGWVRAIGPDVTTVKVGDKILFERYGAIPASEKDFVMHTEDCIFAIIEEEDGKKS